MSEQMNTKRTSGRPRKYSGTSSWSMSVTMMEYRLAGALLGLSSRSTSREAAASSKLVPASNGIRHLPNIVIRCRGTARRAWSGTAPAREGRPGPAQSAALAAPQTRAAPSRK